jgi:hypothetical protein
MPEATQATTITIVKRRGGAEPVVAENAPRLAAGLGGATTAAGMALSTRSCEPIHTSVIAPVLGSRSRTFIRPITGALNGENGAELPAIAVLRLASDVVTCDSTASIGSSRPIAGAVEVGTDNGAASEACWSYRARPDDVSFNKSVAAVAAALNCQIIAMPGVIRVTFQQPLPTGAAVTATGALVAQVYARGAVRCTTTASKAPTG